MVDVCSVTVLEEIIGTSHISRWGLNTESPRYKHLTITFDTSVVRPQTIEMILDLRKVFM